MSVNKVILLGNLGKDPVVRKLDNGRAVAQFTLATNEKYKDKTGNLVTKTEWHNIVAWSPMAEVAEKFLKKGSQVFIEGKIETRDYTDKDGVQRRITEIISRDLRLVDSRSNSGSGYDAPPPADDNYGSGVSKEDIEQSIIGGGVDDELPF